MLKSTTLRTHACRVETHLRRLADRCEGFRPRPLNILDKRLIHVTPRPVLAPLAGTHHRVLASMKVLGRVLILRTIATTHVPASQADAKMNPRIARLQTFLAAIRVRRLMQIDLRRMLTFTAHWIPLPLLPQWPQEFPILSAARWEGPLRKQYPRASIGRECARHAGTQQFYALCPGQGRCLSLGFSW